MVRTEKNCEGLHYSSHLILQDALWCFSSAVEQSHSDRCVHLVDTKIRLPLLRNTDFEVMNYKKEERKQ